MNAEEREVLKLISSGWELGRSCITGKYWLQLGGLGSGKPSKNVADNIAEALLNTNKIYVLYEDPALPTKYALK